VSLIFVHSNGTKKTGKKKEYFGWGGKLLQRGGKTGELGV